MSGPKYDYRIDLDADNAHTRVIRLVGERKQVLELGCARGYMSRVLVERFGCTVTGVEVDGAAADEARKVCRRVIVADLDRLDWVRELSERFDVVVCADVLEHLRDPGGALRGLADLLRPDGYVVASIPNVAHAAVLAELLEGRFRYRPLGLLDEGHLRFFTRESIYETFERAGFVVTHLERLRLEPEATEFRTDLSRLPPGLADLIRSGEESTTYQFVLTARPAAPAGGAAVLRQRIEEATAPPEWPAVAPAPDARPIDWRERLEGVLDALLARMRFLEDERARQGRDLAEAEARATRLQGEVGTHVGHVEFLREEVRRRDSQIRDLAGRIADLDAQLTDLKAGVGWALLERYRRARHRLCPPGSARERVYLALLRGFRAAARRRPRFG
jgi:2-polyprenyl-3-methyl-5-hydroxy-6-metoxy-1,4-benzoquinol methylase